VPAIGGSKVTLADVAAAAQVSIPTASKALRGDPDVAAATRLRVEVAMAELGYSRPARQRSRAGLIDLVFNELSPWAIEIIRGAEEPALSAGVRLAVSTAADQGQRERWLDIVAAGRTDGAILVLTELSPDHSARLADLQVPVVIIDPTGQPTPSIPSIGAANWAGGMTATEHLIELGHRRIGTITGRPDVLCSRARLDGYRVALERAGIGVDDSLIAIGDFHYQSGLEAASLMLDMPDPPTAIFAADDAQALGVYEAARQHNLQIPRDLSVIGFDDVEIAQWASPPLTTLRQPLAEMAALAMRMVLERNADTFNQRVELATNLVVRHSTAPPRQRPAGSRLAARPGRQVGETTEF
jgi:DNA-binding LacI/PurR family transcriptional regulator